MMKRLERFIVKHFPFSLFLIVLSLYRITLTTKGAFYWWDENRHRFALGFIRDLAHGHIGSAVNQLFGALGRPGWILVQSLPASVQALLYFLTGIKSETPTSYRIATLFNVLETAGITLLFYLLSLRLVKNKSTALLATIVSSLLANANMFIPHLYPQSAAIFFYYLTLYLIVVKVNRQIVHLFLIGVLAGFGHLNYPAYYLWPPIFTVLLVTQKEKMYRRAISFLFGFFGFIGVFFLLSKLVHAPFYETLSRASRQGSPGEGLTFLPLYLFNAEGVVGNVLFLLFIIFIFLFLHSFKRFNKTFRLLLLSLFCGYIIYGIFVFQGFMIWYARILYGYLPFFVLAVFAGIEILYRKARWILTSIILITSFISFVDWNRALRKVVFPQDIFFSYCHSYYRCPSFRIKQVNENDASTTFTQDIKEADYVFVNVNPLYPILVDFRKFEPSDNLRLVYSAPHAVKFKPYWFEGYTPHERALLSKRDYEIRIYKVQQ